MANFEKIVKVSDAILNCIPGLSTINNVVQAIYKLAHRVDALNPVAPGLKTSIKIHVLSKENFDYFIGAIPILGNLVNLVALICYGLEDNLIKAVYRNNKEIVHLSLGNNALNNPNRAEEVFRKAAYGSNNEIFQLILNHRDDWDAKSLINALQGCRSASDDKIAKANSILDYWEAHGRVLDMKNERWSAIHTLEDFLKEGKVDLAERIIQILPENIPFRDIKEILFKYSCCQYDYADELQQTGVLTEENRNALLAKSSKPSLKELEEYYNSVGYALKNNKTSENYRETHFDTLNKLLNLAQLQSDEIIEFIFCTLRHGEFAFIESLVAKHEGQLTPESKAKILKKMLSSGDRATVSEKGIQLFEFWIGKWQNDISTQAHKLYDDVSKAGAMDVEISQRRFRMFPETVLTYPSSANIQIANNRFKNIILKAFPSCDKI